MLVHRLYYGPDPEKIDLQTSEGIRNIVSDDIISGRYTLKGSLHRTIFDSQIHQTPDGPVLSLTKVEPCQASDKRACTCNHTLLVSLSSVMEALMPFLDFAINGEQLKPLTLSLRDEG